MFRSFPRITKHAPEPSSLNNKHVSLVERVLFANPLNTLAWLFPFISPVDCLTLDEVAPSIRHALIECFIRTNNETMRYLVRDYQPAHPNIGGHSVAACIKRQFVYDDKVRIGVLDAISRIETKCTILIRESGDIWETRPDLETVDDNCQDIGSTLYDLRQLLGDSIGLCRMHRLPERIGKRIGLIISCYQPLLIKAAKRWREYADAIEMADDLNALFNPS